MKKINKTLWGSAALLVAFGVWTVLVRFVDLRAIGPLGSEVGFAGINGWVHGWTGVHLGLYNLTDWLSAIPLGICGGFGVLGLVQWCRRKHLGRVDGDILALGGFYGLVMGAFLFFEQVVINYRPVLIQGRLEASYPSSTTMLVLCIMPTAVLVLRKRIRHKELGKAVCGGMWAFTLFMVAARFLSGVHWLTDILGGILLSASLVTLYRGVCMKICKEF